MRPVTNRRANTFFAELFLAPGPQAIGATGDNSFAALFGRSWALEWREEDGRLHLHQMSATEVGVWNEVVADLPPVFASPAPVGSRRWSFAFDQAARVVVAYEDDTGVVRVTRWDANSGQYVQNVSFSGADPSLFMDASVASPASVLSGSELAAVEAGLGYVFHWTPTGQWLENATTDSDVLLFYLSADRERVMCRVQRQLYATEHTLWDFETPIILDRVVAVNGRYQLLVSAATGEALPDMLLSNAYVDDSVLVFSPVERVALTASPETLRAESVIANVAPDPEHVALAGSPESVVVVGNIYPYVPNAEGVNLGAVPETVTVVSSILAYVPDAEGVDLSSAPESVLVVVSVIEAEPTEEGISLVGAPETVRVKRV